ncbi:restriction endonuclease subunit M [Ligilactobacillus agilis]|uniref:Restriction endonuclease subunit M n=1 Tax=Ligilactobacillus agilis TaxID=1601 RepID=A0A2I2A9Z7_9LACO|nr:restriction endonuclease subunit M [Ligilactobacillus agilis]PLA76209.1 restriction endonuclease subunit M [Ligilactobacillus agilis]PLA82482.1 restriction endonuclease subunit M [Ligilactobacillus agilis]
MKMTDLVSFKLGSPQFRIKETLAKEAPLYQMYSQLDLEEDLAGVVSDHQENKQVKTLDDVATLKTNDLVFSLISGKAALVSSKHAGYLYTQNYLILEPDERLDAKFLLYLLNEDKGIARQLWLGLQGSMVLKYTVKQVKDLKLPELPSLSKQAAIGQVYLKQKHLQAVKKRRADNELTLQLAKLEEVLKNG